MENKFEEKLKKGYEEYLKLPKAELNGVNKKAEIYVNNWCVLTGRSMAYPHPHRHYTFLEFVFHCGKSDLLYNRFINIPE